MKVDGAGHNWFSFRWLTPGMAFFNRMGGLDTGTHLTPNAQAAGTQEVRQVSRQLQPVVRQRYIISGMSNAMQSALLSSWVFLNGSAPT
jgi:hypothetical protein